jgi:Tfp pilus assembly protein PilX
MKHFNRKSRQRGAALIVGLVLLAVITLLAVVGMNISNSELASANSEQIRLRAFQAAESGLEHGLIYAAKDAGTTNIGEGETLDTEPVEGSPEDEDGNAIDTFTNTVTYHGAGPAPGYSETDYAAQHYAILAEGRSARNAVVRNEMGAFVVGNNSSAPLGALPGTDGEL